MAGGKSLTEKTMVVVFSRVLTSLIDLTTGIIVIRLLSKTDYAILGYLLMIYEVARNLSTLGFPESVFYYFEHLTKNFRKAFALQTTGILALTGLIAGGAILLVKVFAPALISDFDPGAITAIQHLLPLVAIMAVLEIPTWPVHNVLLASDRQKEAGWYQVITSLLSFAALIIPISLGYSIEVAMYSMIGYAAIRFVGSMIWMLLILPPGEKRTPKGNLREQFNFSIPLGISSLVNQFNKYADKFIVSFFLTEAAFAEYGVGAMEVPIIKVIPFAVGTVLISRYVSFNKNGEKENLINLWYKGIRKVALLVIPLTILSIVIAPSLIPFAFETEGTNYTNAILPFQIYNMIILIRIAHYGSILQAFGDTKGILRLSISLVILNVVLSIPFTLWFGIAGTAGATLLANVINWMFLLKRIGGHLEVPFYKVLPMGYYLKVLLITGIIGSALYYFSLNFMAGFSDLQIIGVVSGLFIVLYLAVGSLFKIIEKEDWDNLIEMFRFRFLWK